MRKERKEREALLKKGEKEGMVESEQEARKSGRGK